MRLCIDHHFFVVVVLFSFYSSMQYPRISKEEKAAISI